MAREPDRRDPTSTEREVELDAREVVTQAREALQDDRERKTLGILANAEARDEAAEVRDAIADERDEAASLEAFRGHYGSVNKSRRMAAMDRLSSKSDRTSSSDDRSTLSGDGGTGPARRPPDDKRPGSASPA